MTVKHMEENISEGDG